MNSILLACTVAVAFQGSDQKQLTPEQRVIKFIEDRFVRIPASHRRMYTQQVVAPIRTGMLPDEAIDSYVSRVSYWTFQASKFLESGDAYREMAEEHPQLAPLLLPDRFYGDAYSVAVRGILADVEAASSVIPPVPEQAQAIRKQLDGLASYATELLAQRIEGEGGTIIFSHEVKLIADELKRGIGKPFWGAHRLLTEEELAYIKSSLEEKAKDLGNVNLPSTQYFDDGSGGSVAAQSLARAEGIPEAEKELKQHIRLAYDIQRALSPLYEVTFFNYEASGKLGEQLDKVLNDANVWMKEAKRQNGHIYKAIISGAVDEEIAKSLEEEEGADPTAGGETDPSNPPETLAETTPNRGRQLEHEPGTTSSGEGGRYAIMILLIVAGVVVAGNLWARRIRLRKTS